jgi:large subunit ribosomal protein L22
MADYKYSYQNYDPNSMVRAVGRDLSISPKHAIEICKYIKGRNVNRAVTILTEVIDKTRPIPFTRFIQGVGHKRGQLGSGKYPVKASQAILSILQSAIANAKFKGLAESSLVVESIQAQRGSSPLRFGRIRGRSAKRTHIEVVLKEEKEPKERKVRDKYRLNRYKGNTRRD